MLANKNLVYALIEHCLLGGPSKRIHHFNVTKCDLGSYYGFLCRSHNREEFLSWTSHPVHHVPIAGGKSKFILTSRSKRTHKGFIYLFLSIQADTDKQLEVCA